MNFAALRLVRVQRVHAVSCMVGAPAWRRRGRELRGVAPGDLDLGLHLDLTEHPVGMAPRPLRRLIVASQLRQLDRVALRAEIARQLDAFEQEVGAPPAFVDGHQHVHQFPVVRSELLDELARRYGSGKPWLRSTETPRPGAGVAAAPRLEQAKPRVIEWLGARGLAAMALRHGHAQNRRLLGVYSFEGGRSQYEARLAAWLACARDGDLLMCHPSRWVAGADPLIHSRRAEFEALEGPVFGRLLRERNVELRPMSEILAAIGSTSRALPDDV